MAVSTETTEIQLQQREHAALESIKALSGVGGRAIGRVGEDIQERTYPILSIVSSNSELFKTKQEGFDLGDLYNNVTKENYGPKFRFIPFLDPNTRGRLVMGQGLLCVSRDMKTGDGDPGGDCMACPKRWSFQNKGRDRDCSEEINFFCLPADGVPEPVVIKFRKARYKIGVQLRSQIDIAFTGRPDKYPASWTMVFELSTKEASSREGLPFYQYSVIKVGDATPDQIEMGTRMYQQVASAGMKAVRMATEGVEEQEAEEHF